MQDYMKETCQNKHAKPYERNASQMNNIPRSWVRTSMLQ